MNSCSVLKNARWWRAQGCTGLHNGGRGRRWTVQQTSARGSGRESDAGRGSGARDARGEAEAEQRTASRAGHSRARCVCGRVVDAGGATVPGARCSPDSRCRSGFSLRVVPGPHQIALSTTIVYQQQLLMQLRLRLRLRHTGGGVWDSARGGAQRAWSRGTGANWRWMRKGAMDAGGY